MKQVACDICGGDDPHLFAERSPREDVLHARFVRCGVCGAIYASPRATHDEATLHYSVVGGRGSAIREEEINAGVWEGNVAARQPHLQLAAPFVDGEGARFLDVGFGDGSALAAAKLRRWEPHGVEYSGQLVDATARRLGLDSLVVGGLEDAAYPDAYFDVVYSWHVIEHVLDINAWIAEIGRILKPGGALLLGTENSRSLYGRLWMMAFRLGGRVPLPPTSTDHTHWFSVTSLATLLRRHGFADATVKVYENSPLEIARGQPRRMVRNPRRVAMLGLYLFTSVVSTAFPRLGGKLIAVAVRPQSVAQVADMQWHAPH